MKSPTPGVFTQWLAWRRGEGKMPQHFSWKFFTNIHSIPSSAVPILSPARGQQPQNGFLPLLSPVSGDEGGGECS